MEYLCVTVNNALGTINNEHANSCEVVHITVKMAAKD